MNVQVRSTFRLTCAERARHVSLHVRVNKGERRSPTGHSASLTTRLSAELAEARKPVLLRLLEALR